MLLHVHTTKHDHDAQTNRTGLWKCNAWRPAVGSNRAELFSCIPAAGLRISLKMMPMYWSSGSVKPPVNAEEELNTSQLASAENDNPTVDFQNVL